MMNVMALKRALNNSKTFRKSEFPKNNQIKRKKLEVEGCDESNIYTPEYSYSNGYEYYERDLKENEFICYQTVYTFLAFGDSTDSLIIGGELDRPEGEESIQLDPVNNAFGGSCGLFKITATKDTKVRIYDFVPNFMIGDGIDESMGVTIDLKYYLMLSKNWEGTLTTSYKFTQPFGVSKEQLVVFNPLGSSLTITSTGDGGIILYDNDQQEPPSYNMPNSGNGNGPVISVYCEVDTTLIQELKTYTVTGNVKVESDSIPDFYPDTIVRVDPLSIFTYANEEKPGENSGNGDNKLDDEDNKLTGGEIAGISIACVVVVAIVIFCVVWFAILKKGCSKSKVGNEEQSS